MRYQVWTTRALLIWVPTCLLLGVVPPVASLLVDKAPLHVHVLNSLMLPLMALFVYLYHRRGARIRDSINRYLTKGTRLVIDVPYMSEAEIQALDDGLHDARRDCWRVIGSEGAVADKISYAHAEAFLIIRSEVLLHRAGKKVRVGGVTYVGAMVLEYTSDLALLRDRARHEGCHYILNVLGRPDWTGEDHHRAYPELFA